MGPAGGHRGGAIVAAGTPEEVAEVPESYTGQFLRPVLGLTGEAAGGHDATARAEVANNGKPPRKATASRAGSKSPVKRAAAARR
jgi:excinuclease ABC subunit A